MSGMLGKATSFCLKRKKDSFRKKLFLVCLGIWAYTAGVYSVIGGREQGELEAGESTQDIGDKKRPINSS